MSMSEEAMGGVDTTGGYRFIEQSLEGITAQPIFVAIEQKRKILTIKLPKGAVLSAHSWIVLAQKKKILWARLVTQEELVNQQFVVDLTEIGIHLCENHVPRASFALFSPAIDAPVCYQSFKLQTSHPIQDDKIIVHFDPVALPANCIPPHTLVFHQETADNFPTIAAYVANNSSLLAVVVCWSDELLSRFVSGIADVARCKRNGYITLKVKLRKGNYRAKALELIYRSVSESVSFVLDTTVYEQGDWIYLSTCFDTNALEFREIYWDLLIDLEQDGKVVKTFVKCSRALIKRLAVWGDSILLDKGLLLFPYPTSLAYRLAFAVRPASRYDSFVTRFYGIAARIFAQMFGSFYKDRHIWLVYEKFCELAEDNGYHFFRYCMEELSAEEKKDIYYVIDKKAPAYDRVKQYGRHIIRFMSFKHLFYALIAKLYVGSDSSAHLYQWRAKPNIIQSRIRKHDMLFLQHGVIALKRVDQGFGADSASPITYFLTSSQAEKKIIVDHFGYADHQVAVLGLSRWDALENRANKAHPAILVMPTWRPWLEEQSMNIFVQSDYFKAYQALLTNKKLMGLLEMYDATLQLFIHPKINEFIEAFHTDNPRVQLIPLGERPLNELIMECSLLVTDYSSVCWDVLYQNKPVVFYQFDQTEFLEYVGSYIDFACDLPGPVGTTIDETVKMITSVLENDCVALDVDLQKAAQWYAFRDKENRARTYQFIKARGY